MFFTSPINPSFNEQRFKCRLRFPSKLCQVSPKKWGEQKHGVLCCLSCSFMIQNTQQDVKTNTKLLSISFMVYGYLEKKSQDLWKALHQTLFTSPLTFHKASLGTPNNLERFNGSNSGLLPLICAWPGAIKTQKLPGIPIMSVQIIPYNQGYGSVCFLFCAQNMIPTTFWVFIYFKIESRQNFGPSFWVDLSPCLYLVVRSKMKKEHVCYHSKLL